MKQKNVLLLLVPQGWTLLPPLTPALHVSTVC